MPVLMQCYLTMKFAILFTIFMYLLFYYNIIHYIASLVLLISLNDLYSLTQLHQYWNICTIILEHST